MFARPVDSLSPITNRYRDKGPGYDWVVDPDTGFWVPGQDSAQMGEHHGVDFDCKVGTVVRAMCDGFIVRTRFETDDAGGAGLYILQLVIMPGFDSWTLKYAHLSGSFVKVGQSVPRGFPIAQSGQSGKCDTPRLHVDLMNLQRQWQEIPLD